MILKIVGNVNFSCMVFGYIVFPRKIVFTIERNIFGRKPKFGAHNTKHQRDNAKYTRVFA